MSVEFGFARFQHEQPCAVDTRSPGRTVCGRTVESLPVSGFARPGEVPGNLHEKCRAVLDAHPELLAVEPDPADGACPACKGIAPVVGGLVGRHAPWVRRSGIWKRAGGDCAGAGSEPVEEL